MTQTAFFDIIDTLKLVANCNDKDSKDYIDAMKLLNARINNLETNLHIEIDMERLEDASKAEDCLLLECVYCYIKSNNVQKTIQWNIHLVWGLDWIRSISTDSNYYYRS